MGTKSGKKDVFESLLSEALVIPSCNFFLLVTIVFFYEWNDFFIYCAKLVGLYQSPLTGKFNGLLIGYVDSFLRSIFYYILYVYEKWHSPFVNWQPDIFNPMVVSNCRYM